MFGTAHDDARRGTIVAAIWLIGLGVVFLVQQWIDRPWGEAWPLFLILVGAASLIGKLLGPAHGAASFVASAGWSLLLIAAGVILLLSTAGVLDVAVGDLIGRGWPFAAIALGLWFLIAAAIPSRGGSSTELSLPLGGASSASVRIRFGGGELTAGASAPGTLVDGRFQGGVVSRSSESGRVELRPPGGWDFPWFREWPNWELGLTAEVPLDLDLEGGASRSRLDLGELQLRSLRLQTGASETTVRLPRHAGETRVRAEAGAAQLTFEVPSGVAVKIRSRMALGSTHVDASVPRSGDGWESPDYAGAENRVEMDLGGGVGQIRVTVAA